MHRLLKRAGGVATIGLSAALLPLMAAAPAGAAPGPQSPAPSVTPNPVATAATNFTLSNGTCDGTAGAGWRVQTFIVNAGVDISTLVFDQGVGFDQVGTDRDNSNGSIRSALWKDNAPGSGYEPAGSPAGLINPSDLQGFDFSNAGWVLTDDVYQIGYACIDPVGTLSQWWSQTVTIDGGAVAPGGNFMAVGLAPPAPVIVDGPDDADGFAANVTGGAMTVDFDGTGADNWTAQVSTVSGDFSAPNLVGTSTTATSQSQNITVSGLSTGVQYYVRVLATKAGFAPVASAQAGPFTESIAANGVQNLVVTDSGTDNGAGLTYVDVDWDAPAATPGCTVSGYTVTSSPAGDPAVLPAPGGDATSARITDVPANQSITVTVTPTYVEACQAPAANAPAFIQAGNIVIQQIDVTRPVGALVLTQICGNNGALPAEGAGAAATFGGADNGASNTPGTRDDQVLTNAPLGFGRPGALPAIPGTATSTVALPWLTGAGVPSLVSDPALGTPMDQAAASDDPQYLEYPYPTTGGVADPAATTYCGLDLGVAEFVTQGSGAGQYFAADAALNQVTVVDTRNVDAGWTVTGEMEDFVAASFAGDGSDADGLDEFSGDFLGWTPVVTEDTPTFDSDADGVADYDQQVVAGPVVGPNTFNGLGNGETLAVAAPGEGLGTAILDARVKLLIPVTADAGLYEADLTFSAI